MMGFINHMNRVWKVLVGKDQPTSQQGIDSEVVGSTISDISTIDNRRQKKYKVYVDMDDSYGQEVSTSLDAVADMVLRRDDPRESIMTIESDSLEVTKFIKELIESLSLDKWLWTFARSLSKFGDLFVEIVWSKKDENGSASILRLVPLPVSTMYLNIDDKGEIDPINPYKQEIDGQTVAKFRPWQIIHFRLQREPTDDYGTSILKPARLPFRQLRAMENSLVISRIKKPHVRVHKIDVTNQPPDVAKGRIEDYKNSFKKEFWINPNTGKLEQHSDPLMMGDDIYMGVTKDGGKFAGIDLLEGRSEIDIKDILYIRGKMLAALKVPKHRMNINDVGASVKLASVDQGLYFSAAIHHIQLALIAGFELMFGLGLVVKGVAGNKRNTYKVFLPVQRTTDELIAARVQLIKSTVAKNYGELGILSNEFIMKKFLHMDPEDIKNVELALVKQQKKDKDNDSDDNKNGKDKNKNFNKTGMGSAPVRAPKKEDIDRVCNNGVISVAIESVNDILRKNKISAKGVDLESIKGMIEAANVSVNKKGVANANLLIKLGKVNRTSSWSFSVSDGNRLLGKDGDDWSNYGKWHLAIRADTDSKTKEHYAYPIGKNGKLYRKGVIAAKSRAAQQGETDIANAADRLLNKIDK